MKFAPTVGELLDTFSNGQGGVKRESAKNSDAVSALAVLYEKARNAVELRADHLVRRAAIERILKRRFVTDKSTEKITKNLVLELTWAKYIDSSLVTAEKKDKIEKIVARYQSVKDLFFKMGSVDGVTWDEIVGISSAEIDDVILPDIKRSAFVKFFYLSQRPSISLEAKEEEDTDMSAYIAIERSLYETDNSAILYHLLKMSEMDFFNKDEISLDELGEFTKSVSYIKPALSSPDTLKIQKQLKKRLPPFLIIRDFLYRDDIDFRKVLEKEKVFEKYLRDLAKIRYAETGVRVRRAAIRSFVYILFTKMIFVLAIEIPYDLYIAKDLDYLPLFINVLIPPVLLILAAGIIAPLGEENTDSLVTLSKNILYNFDEYLSQSPPKVEKKERSPVLTTIFTVVYIVFFGATFWVLNYLLGLIGFSLVSKMVFVFFVGLVSFFAYNVRQSAKEYEVVERRNMASPFVDLLSLPFLKVGQVFSGAIAKLNMVAFFFDFILEAPLKTIFGLLDEWFRFVSLKKEEIV